MFLYLDIRLLYPDYPRWPDMKLLMLRQGYKNLFPGNCLPRTQKQVHKWLGIADDVSLSFLNAAPDAKKSKRFNDHTKCRRLHVPSKLTRYFGKRTAAEVNNDRDIDAQTAKWIRDAGGDQLNLPEEENADKLRDLEKDWKGSSKPDEILERLAKWLEADAIDIYLD
ncbi:hypothetical protein BU23DRAFT_574365 [Bimuria novae-zelandiae CBS 107.79]|uniref:Uncharacterized protein n=1 Tax=Bimuria novae-zelandiae CBS 107.79 TaxID=1447943 RepID=A0A6A5UNP2_9PLEO|nr:hypothetical protein BU23DRAFT_574365 [Bimuria novae-zelandiae CBS 107.79]